MAGGRGGQQQFVVIANCTSFFKMETKDVGGRQEILTKWKELLSKQPEALIHSNRAPLPVSPYVCFCLSEQQSIKEKLCRENPNITVSVRLFNTSSYFFNLSSCAVLR